MLKRGLCIAMACLLCVLWAMPTAAETTFSLLPAEESAMSSVAGEATLLDQNAIKLTADTAEGATVAVEINQTIHVEKVRYLQLSLSSTAPFNIALKMSGAQYDLFPQTAGPSWYEVFQDTAPGEGEGVQAGSYTLSLDIAHYVKYNGIELSQTGYATLKTVHIALRGAGTMTVQHLAISDMSTFYAPNGQIGTAATTRAPITTAPHEDGTTTTESSSELETTVTPQSETTTVPMQTQPTVSGETQPTVTYASIATPQSIRDARREGVSPYVWVILIGGVCLAASAVLPFMNKWLEQKRKKK